MGARTLEPTCLVGPNRARAFSRHCGVEMRHRAVGCELDAQRVIASPTRCALGGWKAQEVLVRSYQQVDAETIENVVLHPTHRMVSR